MPHTASAGAVFGAALYLSSLIVCLLAFFGGKRMGKYAWEKWKFGIHKKMAVLIVIIGNAIGIPLFFLFLHHQDKLALLGAIVVLGSVFLAIFGFGMAIGRPKSKTA